MLDIGWTELLVIAIVLIVVVGPKDLPPMIRAFGKMTANLRKMAGDFRTQFDEALKESELDDVRKTISDAQRLNPTNALRDAINPLRQMGQEIKSDLQKATQMPSPVQPQARTDIEAQKAVEGAPETQPEIPVSVPAPAMTLPSEPPVVAAPAVVPAATAPVQQAAVIADAASAKPKPVRKPAAPKAKAVTAAAEPTLAAVAAKPKRVPAASAETAEVAAVKAPARKRTVKKAEEPKGEA